MRRRSNSSLKISSTFILTEAAELNSPAILSSRILNNLKAVVSAPESELIWSASSSVIVVASTSPTNPSITQEGIDRSLPRQILLRDVRVLKRSSAVIAAFLRRRNLHLEAKVRIEVQSFDRNDCVLIGENLRREKVAYHRFISHTIGWVW